MVASILNVDLDPFRHRVLLDKGSADGVFKGQAVLDAQGIFGQVWRVNARTAEVILISDAEHAIPVQSNRSGVRTIAVGTGDPSQLSLPFVTIESDLKKGDLLITTGMGGVFPPGYPVARVTRVERTAKATFAIVEARPTATLDRDREVLLVWFDAPAPGAPVRLAPTAAVPEARARPAPSAPQPGTSAPSAAGAAPVPQPGAASANPPGTASSAPPRPAAETHAPPTTATTEEPAATEAAPAGPAQSPATSPAAQPETPGEAPAPQPEPATTPPGGTR
jgi:rod shape-determining protein MreC